MSDEERHVIGIKYKEAGNAEATKLGYSLVSGENKANKVNAWKAFINEYPSAMLYCFEAVSALA